MGNSIRRSRRDANETPNRQSSRRRLAGTIAPANSSNQHVRCPRCQALLLVPPGNPPFFLCPCGTRLSPPANTDGSSANGSGSPPSNDLRMEQMVNAINRMNHTLNTATQEQNQQESEANSESRTFIRHFGQPASGERGRNGDTTTGASFFQRLAATDRNPASQGNVGPIGSGPSPSSVQVIMCEQCGRIGMLPNDNATAVFLCPCGNPVLAATPNQLLSFLFRGGRGASLMGDTNSAAPPGLVRQLPVITFVKDENGKSGAEDDDDKVSCRVCLSEYEDQEELKILPCFHRFHVSCIDEWLKRSAACPLCNNLVTQHGNFPDG